MKCLILASSFITLGLVIVSAARDIVAIGVLNSCVILFRKSDFISEIFFCLIIKKRLSANVARIMNEKSNDPPRSQAIAPST